MKTRTDYLDLAFQTVVQTGAGDGRSTDLKNTQKHLFAMPKPGELQLALILFNDKTTQILSE